MKTAMAVVGKWPSILPMLGVDQELLSGKHVDCPLCDRKKDFRFDDNEGAGTWICVCGGGNGWSLLNELKGWDFRTAAREVDKVIGNAKSVEIVKVDDTQKRKNRLNKMYKRSTPAETSDHVLSYLKHRGLTVKTLAQISPRLRVVESLDYYEDGQVAGTFDSMVSLVTQNGKAVTLHVTYLDEGDKANIESSRKILPTLEKLSGAACELFEFSDELGVAEGVETALSAFELFNVPTWACINSGNMEGFKVPEGVTKFHIFGDSDAGFTGQASAFSLAKKTVEAARRARRKLEVTVHIPDFVKGRKSTDWNDVLRESRLI